jgi:plastocyanin
MRIPSMSLPGKIGIAALLLAAFALVSFAYVGQQSGQQVPRTTMVSIPAGSDKAPSAFNVTTLLSGTYKFPVNITLVLGVNNSVQWRNDDDVTHTVSSFMVPKGGQAFNSNLIPPGGTFEVSLTVPGQYRYACLWHPWVAGQITVKARQ